jgi:hypothetical protein
MCPVGVTPDSARSCHSRRPAQASQPGLVKQVLEGTLESDLTRDDGLDNITLYWLTRRLRVVDPFGMRGGLVGSRGCSVASLCWEGVPALWLLGRRSLFAGCVVLGA